jgi:hypothetical protein
MKGSISQIDERAIVLCRQFPGKTSILGGVAYVAQQVDEFQVREKPEKTTVRGVRLQTAIFVYEDKVNKGSEILVLFDQDGLTLVGEVGSKAKFG